MFAALFGPGRAKEKHEHAAEELQRLLREKASLVVDDRLISALGVGRKTVYRIIYDMVRRERMYMLADGNDQMLLMTNTEFSRFLFRRAGWEMREMPEPAARTAKRPVMKMTAADSDICLETDDSDIALEENWEIPAAALDSSLAGNLSNVIPEPLPGAKRRLPAAARPASGRDEFEWFTLDIEAAETDGAEAELPEYRQSLPERRREAWTVMEKK